MNDTSLIVNTARAAVLSVVVVLCLFSPNNYVRAAEGYDRPFQKEVQKIQQLLLSSRFSELENIQAESRNFGAAISDGQQRLAVLYQGISGCSQGCVNTLPPDQFEMSYTRLQEWSKEYPQSIAPRVALASYFLGKAWTIRGNGYAGTVDPSAWGTVEANVSEALTRLRDLDQRYRIDPGWYAAMLEVALAQGWPPAKFYSLFDEATKKYPYYMPLYFTGAHYSSPRWYGSISDLGQLVDKSVSNTREKWAVSLYARLNWALSTNTMFQDGQADWPKMRAGFQKIVGDYPDAWNVNNFARFACFARDWETLLMLSSTIGSQPISAAWNGNTGNYGSCLSRAKNALAGK